MNWPVICARCGKTMSINALSTHYKNKHDWKTKTGGTIDPRSNPMWKMGGTP